MNPLTDDAAPELLPAFYGYFGVGRVDPGFERRFAAVGLDEWALAVHLDEQLGRLFIFVDEFITAFDQELACA